MTSYFSFQAIPPSFSSVDPGPENYKFPDCLQVLIEPPEGEEDCLYRPIAHESAYLHATGEAIYVDDIPSYPGEG